MIVFELISNFIYQGLPYDTGDQSPRYL